MLRYLVTGLLFLACARNHSGAVFLHLDDIPGESTSNRRENWIEVESFSWGAQKTTNVPPSFSALHFQKKVDKSSPKLMLHVSNGRVLETGVLEILRPGDSSLRMLGLKMKDVLISSYQTGGSAGDVPRDYFSLSFNAIQWTYTEVKSDRPLRDVSTSFDLTAGTGTGGETVADSDDDGLPDDYEALYGLNVGAADADSDFDKDGMTNGEEFRAGTLPNKADSIFRVSGMRADNGTASLNWEATPGKTYRLMGAATPDQPFQFVRFLTEAEAAAGVLNINTGGQFQFYILQVD